MQTWDSVWSDLCAQIWDFRDDGARSGADNMALDLRLLEEATRPTLRLYTWERPTLSLGRNQSDDWVDVELCKRLNVEVVRRPTGGRALLHMDDEITYAVILPQIGDLSVRQSFEGIASVLGRALQKCGLDVEATASSSAPAAKLNPHCGEVVTAGEVCWHGRKLVGSAQVRQQGRLLQHGSLLRRGDRGLLQQIMPNAHSRLTLEDIGRAELTSTEIIQAWREILDIDVG